jgi:hypothetical protein
VCINSPRKMMSAFETIIASIECKICCEISNIKSLPCGHSLCEKCIELTTEEGRNFKCHFCNQKKRMPKNGFPKNYSVNDISDAIKCVPSPCPQHLLFSLNMKCMTCPDSPILCLQCYQLEHLGHYLIPSHWTIEEGLDRWKGSFFNSENLLPKVETVVMPPPVDIAEISTQTDEHDDKSTIESLFSNQKKIVHNHYPLVTNDLQRGDCVLYLYRSHNNGEIHLGLAVIHRILSYSQISSRYRYYHQRKEEMEKSDSTDASSIGSQSYFDSLDRKLKRRRINDSLDEIQSHDLLLKVSPLKIQISTSSSSAGAGTGKESSSSTTDMFSVLISPSNVSLVDVPHFSVISSNITILLSGTEPLLLFSPFLSSVSHSKLLRSIVK